jgi:hypothetical protein
VDGISAPVQPESSVETTPQPIAVAGAPSAVAVQLPGPPEPPDPPKHGWQRPLGISLLAVGLIAAAGFAWQATTRKTASAQLDATQRFKAQSVPLANVTKELAAQSTANTLTVGGQLHVNNTMVLVPTDKPKSGVTGQVYYDKTDNQISVFNGTDFVSLQGGSNTYVTNNIAGATNVTRVSNVSNVTNVTNVTNTGSTGLGGSGTAGQLAMFTGAGTLGDALINQTGTSLTIGTAAGAGTAVLQAGTGGVSLTTGAQAGPTGDITIQTGTSSTVAAGDVTIDTGPSIVTGTLINTKTFEAGTDNMVDGFGYTDTLASSTAQAHSGTHSLAITQGLSPVNQPQFRTIDAAPSGSFPVVAGHKYAFSAWVRAGTTSATIYAEIIFSITGFNNAGFGEQVFGTVTDTAASWKQVTGIITAPAGANYVLWQFESDPSGAAGDVHYIDDINMTDLSSSTSIANINIGATNAQQVTIGNANQINATAIYGSGVTINGGQGDTSLTGGALAINGSGNSTIGINGSLTIRANATSDWGIAGSGGPGAGLTVHAGDAGGNNNGGNLALQSGTGAGTGTGGNVSIDTGAGTVTGTVVETLDFESGTQNVRNWFGTTVSTSAAAAHTGAWGIAEVGDGSGAWGIEQDQNQAGAPVTAGHTYYYSVWVHAATTSETIGAGVAYRPAGAGATLNSVVDTQTGWTHITGTAVAPAGATQAYMHFTGTEAGGETHYFDDLQVTDLSSSSAVSALTIGATNAQFVTLGNMNEIGATTINGGSGINLNSGMATTNISGGVINVTGSASSLIQTTAGALNLTSADSATWKIADSAGPGGNLSISSGGSSTTAGGNAQSNAAAHSGSFSVAVTAIGGNWGMGMDENAPGALVTAGHTYFFSAWARAATTSESIGSFVTWIDAVGNTLGTAPLTPIIDTNTGWTQISGTAVAPAGAAHAYYAFFSQGAPGEVHYFDDFVTTDLSSSSSISRLMLGATNAQFVTLGNMNEIGSTTIQGSSGIDINSGVSNLNVTGGAINITGSGTSTLQTTGGALNITSAGSALWQIATASSGNGGNLTIHAGGGAGGNSNGGNITLGGGSATGIGTAGNVVIKNAADSTTGFQVQDATGTPVFNVDTTGSRIGVNGSIEANGPSGALYLYNQTGSATNGFSLYSDANNLYIHNVTDGQNVMEFNRPNVGPGEVNLTSNWGFSVTGDNAAALLIQDSTSAALLTADTTTMTVTVKTLIVSANLTVNGHIITGGVSPAVAAGAAACTTPTVSVSGTDTSGTITVTTGTGCAAPGKLATVTFATAYGAAPRVVIAPGSALAAGLSAYTDNATVSTTGFDLATGAAPASSTTYKWNYWIAQ